MTLLAPAVVVLGGNPGDVHALIGHLRQALAQHGTAALTDRLPGPFAADATVLLLTRHPDATDPDTRQQAARDAQERLLREQLLKGGWPHHIISGATRPAQLSLALHALGLPPSDSASTLQREQAQFDLNRGRTRWSCEKCSDPDCEHRLFTGLLRHAKPPISEGHPPQAPETAPRP